MADGSTQPIEAPVHPSIHADYVPTFTNNLIGVSPIIDNDAVDITKHDKRVLLDRNPYVDKLFDFVIYHSKQNNLLILTGISRKVYLSHQYPRQCGYLPL